ncbi:hypothetical protein [Nostoc sp. PA-18-2419]|uniref:hypothetical protein n=1 Tax=Nostoc sp. PA-18-2419 TaxID=2575443 RepID=UPI001674B1D1|nr:hypothetical protein [Nostoc sp. PA-18-2419]
MGVIVLGLILLSLTIWLGLRRYERGWQYRNLFNNLEGEELNFFTELPRQYKSWLQVCV